MDKNNKNKKAKKRKKKSTEKVKNQITKFKDNKKE